MFLAHSNSVNNESGSKSVCFLALNAKYKSRLNYFINITFQHENNLTLYCSQNYDPHPCKECTTPPRSKNPIRVRWVCCMTEPINFQTYPWRRECPTIQWCLGNTFTCILLTSTNDVKNQKAIATRNSTQATARTIIQLTELTRQP